ncbi:polysaccharide pyruvyl transferase family protein, partial [uncultured Muribaculum sp.]|uniref:polysaccharide pyruvyl transferase family protein n=1 Tax=uncultured Muribaculum sp. TaxID=1918613 RepID=UPI002636BBF6
NSYFLPEVYEQAKEASRITGLKVITSTLAPKTILPSKDFMKILEVGPREFLYLVKNAEYVIGRSFHVAVFAMIFQKKFIAVEGMNDSRLGNFLKEINMERCATLQGNVKVVLKNLDSENPPIHACMDRLRESGIKFLRENLL